MYLEQFHSEYETLSESRQNDFSRIVSRLQNETFIIKECETDKDDYFFLLEHTSLFSNYFALTDYDFIADSNRLCFYIKTSLNRNRVQLNKFDTVVLLNLRLIYHQKKKEASSFDNVLFSLDELVEKVRTTQIFNPEKKLSAYVDTLKKLRTHKIVYFTGSKLGLESTIQILPSILIVIPQEDLVFINDSLKALKGDEGGEEDEDSNED